MATVNDSVSLGIALSSVGITVSIFTEGRYLGTAVRYVLVVETGNFRIYHQVVSEWPLRAVT